jgi:hypothetical protein
MTLPTIMSDFFMGMDGAVQVARWIVAWFGGGGWVTEVIGAAATRTPIEASSLCREVRGPSTTFGWSPHFAQDVSTWVR